MHGVFLLLCLLIAVHGRKLSEAENLARFQSCGKYSNEFFPFLLMFSKVFHIFSCDPRGFCNRNRISGKLTKGVFLGRCDGTKEPFGLVVLEFDRDFAESESVAPVCLDEDVTAEIGDKLEVHYFDYDNQIVQRRENIVVDCGNKKHPDGSVCVKNNKCFWYQGGAFVKNIGGRMTAVAVDYEYGCEDKDTIHVNLPIKKFLPAICEFTGVCQPPPPTTTLPPTTTPSPPPPPITDKINEENDQKTEEQTNENFGSASSENSSTGTQTLELFGVLALFCYLY